ncbi:hypothetical protein [Actinocatenispora rupis]|uniref:Uncharacterized protein n=1 Tax=Actinocatenispora rupis TaxID=519421 RepID=A0A8J3NFV4_9ACTN|nr:hypothetical protein [Actinocatenispora rupis]GID15290.1 hypothetical protein Aru02nite_61790 [Actinocatenispora rupis]
MPIVIVVAVLAVAVTTVTIVAAKGRSGALGSQQPSRSPGEQLRYHIDKIKPCSMLHTADFHNLGLTKKDADETSGRDNALCAMALVSTSKAPTTGNAESGTATIALYCRDDVDSARSTFDLQVDLKSSNATKKRVNIGDEATEILIDRDQVPLREVIVARYQNLVIAVTLSLSGYKYTPTWDTFEPPTTTILRRTIAAVPRS